MNKPKDFDTAKAWGNSEPLPAGGYVCKIVGVKEGKSRSGNEKIEIALDIAEGDEANRFMTIYNGNADADKKWPAGAVKHQIIYGEEGKTHGQFKQFTDCVIDSNTGFEIVWGDGFCDCFKNRLIGVLWGREQYKNDKGELKWSTKPLSFVTTEDIRNGNYRTPEDKYFQGNNSPTSGFGPISDDDIPF